MVQVPNIQALVAPAVAPEIVHPTAVNCISVYQH